jgi:hypothetical protein
MRRLVLVYVLLCGCSIREVSLTGDSGLAGSGGSGGGTGGVNGGDGGGHGGGGRDAHGDGFGTDAMPDACVPQAEICNGLDDDCDGVIDNGFDLNNDVDNCGSCNNRCLYANGVGECRGGTCHLASCAFGYGDADHDPANGCECLKSNNGVEVCDGIDNDCNGIVDDNFDLQTNVENCGVCGHRCGFQNAVGACQNGQCVLDHCLPNFYNLDGDASNGCEYGCLPSNGGVEVCDGLDNDCNGQIDDNPTDAGARCFPFGVGCTRDSTGAFTCTGACRPGTTTCQNGFLQCIGFVGPSPEICDNIDNDCNGVVDDPFNKQTDPLHCGGCSPCTIPNAIPSCINGVCGIAACRTGFYNVDGNLANGCEYACDFTGPEVCDGVDNNCDGRIDEGFNLQSDVGNCGTCGHRCAFNHATPSCVSGSCVMGPCDPGYVDLDGQSANGCEYACTRTSATETCNGVDDNCNGTIDEGFNLQTDVANCGTCGHRCAFNHAAATCVNGACVMGNCDAGFINLDGQPGNGCEYQCTPSNGGVEICDGRDNNCNGTVDENNPGGGQPCNPPLASDPSRWNVGVCRAGTTVCSAGNLVCMNYVGPQTEVCDNLDNDCNGIADDPFNKQSDPNNCGSCGHVCSSDFTSGTPHAVAGCQAGVCVIAGCDAGYYNLDGTYANGCEYACPNGAPGTPEVCDGVDNDCDGLIDGADVHPCTTSAQCPQAARGETCTGGRCSFDLQPVANFCVQLGECAGSSPQCTGGQWVCNYGPTVQTTGPNQIIGNETLCDGRDNDCDGCVDESFPQAPHSGPNCATQAGQPCVDSGIGACQGHGNYACNGTHDGVRCNVTVGGAAPTDELCDGIDNDCDGFVDESWDDDSRLGNRCAGARCKGVRPQVATVGATSVARFEAARPDADRPTPCTSNAQCSGGTQCNVSAGACEKPCSSTTAVTDCGSGLCVVPPRCTASNQCAAGRTCSSGACTCTSTSECPSPETCNAGTCTTDRGFCLPSAGTRSPIACTVDSQCVSGVCARIPGASGCTSASGQPQCFCLPGAGGGAPLACSVAGVEPWSGVTFAQAQFACALAGMRLCRTTRNGSDQVTSDEWGAACGASSFPYGSSYQAQTCNGHDLDADSLVAFNQDQPAPTGNLAQCVAASTVMDLSGNLAEWTDDFRTTLSDGTNRRVYTLRGGAFDNVAGGLGCGFFGDVAPEDFAFPNTGFRCCGAASCSAGQADCGAAGCRSLADDAAHCGFCGHACAGGQICCNGGCKTGSCP